jgi:hypothetical protein
VRNFDKGEAEAEEKTSETVIQKIFDELPVKCGETNITGKIAFCRLRCCVVG